MDHVNDLDDRTVWQSSLERSISTVAIMLSFTPSVRFVVNGGKGGERGFMVYCTYIY